MGGLTAVVIARDEERAIGRCLDSVAWADERLVVLDDATRDRTAEIAAGRGARVERRRFRNFAAQRNAGLALATTPWVLFVDADESVPPALRDEIRATLAEPDGRVGFWIPRRNHMLGRVVRGGGWYPDYQLRLLERTHARFDDSRPVHEVAELDGPAGCLTEPLEHASYRSLAEFMRKQDRYCALEARRWLAAHGRPRARALLGQPARELWRRYVQLGGWREGAVGLALSLVLAWYAGKAVWLARRAAPTMVRLPTQPPGAARQRS
jgi:(heptosyl)LPS beta-1,4-glucosyltransferase